VISLLFYEYAIISGDIYEQAFVKTLAGFFHGNSKHLFGVTRSRGATRLSSGEIKGVRLPHRGYILGEQGTVNFTFFREIEHFKFTNKFVANNSVFVLLLSSLTRFTG